VGRIPSAPTTQGGGGNPQTPPGKPPGAHPNSTGHRFWQLRRRDADDVLTFIAAEAEDILDTLNTPIFQDRPSSCLKDDPVSCSDCVQTDHLGQEYSCDPSPFHERDVDIAAAALAAAQAAHSAATAVNSMRLMLIKRAHDFHLAALAAAEDDDFDAHHGTPQAVKASVGHIRATRGRDLPICDNSTLQCAIR
jgi:hypothetical protein